MEPKQYQTQFIEKEQISKDTYSFFFKRPDGMEFEPGQYIRLFIDTPQPDNRGNARYFSISTSPTLKDRFSVTTRVIESTFKKSLLEMRPNMEAKFFGPMGTFVLKPSDISPKVFIAGGIGITPFLSMIRFAADKNLQTPITLLSSFSTVEDMIYYDELLEYTKKNNNLKLQTTITKPDESKNQWHGLTGRINEEFVKKNIDNIQSSTFFLCGPPPMVEAMIPVVKGLNVEENKIKIERFTGY